MLAALTPFHFQLKQYMHLPSYRIVQVLRSEDSATAVHVMSCCWAGFYIQSFFVFWKHCHRIWSDPFVFYSFPDMSM